MTRAHVQYTAPVLRSAAQSSGSGPAAPEPLAVSCSHMARMPLSVMPSTVEGIGTLVGRAGSRGFSPADTKRPFLPFCTPKPFDFFESGAPWFHCFFEVPLARFSAISCSRLEPCA